MLFPRAVAMLSTCDRSAIVTSNRDRESRAESPLAGFGEAGIERPTSIESARFLQRSTARTLRSHESAKNTAMPLGVATSVDAATSDQLGLARASRRG